MITLKLFFAVLLSATCVIACKSIPYGDSETTDSMQSELHGSLEEYTAEDYCVPHGEFFCIKTNHSACICAGMCMIGPANSSTDPIVVAGLCPYYPHDSRSLIWCFHPLYAYY